MFECSVVDESKSGLDQSRNDEISQHLKTILEEMQRYFPELSMDTSCYFSVIDRNVFEMTEKN